MSRAPFHRPNTPGPEPVEPRRLELVLNLEDGSLQTAPLLAVIMAATDGLYNDLYQMAHGELEVTSAQPPPGAEEDEEEQDAAANTAGRREKMANLSFAQRRHELAWRLASHSRTLTHVGALTAANATTNLANATQVSTRALQHARTAWVQADEAQDALYFFHAKLFPARAAPHDVYGALDVLLAGAWPDLPQDLKLTVDRYENSDEKEWGPNEVSERWHMAVRDKLMRGEVGWMKQNQVSVPWEISMRGGVVRLTHGRPKTIVSGNETKTTYPIEAILTVLSTSHQAQWTLVNVEVQAQAKTGQSNHQLDTTNRQCFDLHRLCALAMNKEEQRVRNKNKETETDRTLDTMMADDADSNLQPASVPRPLNCLFKVAHMFALSWQLEILSAQAQALRRGMWGTTSSSVVVTPVQFFENRSILGIVSISFWSVDDRYGPPLMGDLHFEDDSQYGHSSGNRSSGDSVSTVSRSINTPSITNQLTLSVRAEANVGIRVALSGTECIMEFASTQPHIRATIQELLEATSNPFTLSASEALLAATRLCAERKCYAMVQVLPKHLPSWISLRVEKGSIAVAARIQYDFGDKGKVSLNDEPVVLFRLACDARTGTFASSFARSTALLRNLSCNDIRAASDTTALRMVHFTKSRRAGRSNTAGAAAALASGRVVRDAFDGLSRSMNVLGQRSGVGGGWKDIDERSASLRTRAIDMACKDVRTSLVNCCGIAAVFGLSSLAMSVATGISPQVDAAGGPISDVNGHSGFLNTPPLSIVVDQRIVDTTSHTTDGERINRSHTEQELFGICCTAHDDGLTLIGATIFARMETPMSIPQRTGLTLTSFPQRSATSTVGNSQPEEPPAKRTKLDSSNGEQNGNAHTRDLMDEVENFAMLISETLDLQC